MKSLMTLILPLALAALVASCGPKPATDCAGWRAVTLDDATVDRLAAEDPQALREIISHHETGRARGCW